MRRVLGRQAWSQLAIGECVRGRELVAHREKFRNLVCGIFDLLLFFVASLFGAEYGENKKVFFGLGSIVEICNVHMLCLR